VLPGYPLVFTRKRGRIESVNPQEVATTKTKMIECPACGCRLRPGTLFCSECGVFLPTGDLLLTGTLPTEALPDVGLPASQADPSSLLVDEDKDAELPPTATTLYLIVARNYRQKRFRLPIGEIWLGRTDASHGVFPEMDLDPDGGMEEGVSRQHAKIYQEGNYLFIEDAGSTNGTFLNNQRLTPHLPSPLQNGDTLRLGRLRLLVRINSKL
jgi:hypothetical protein